MTETVPSNLVNESPEKRPVDLRQHAQRAQARAGSEGPEAGRKRDGLNLLYLCHRVPCPPDKGDKIRAYHEILSLARHHRVHLLTLADCAVPDLSPLAAVCERVEVFPISRPAAFLRAAAGALRPRPLTLSFFESAAMRRRIEELAASEKFDLVVAYSSSMAPYAELVEGVPAVLDMVDVDSAKWQQYSRFGSPLKRPVYALEARRLQSYEAGLAKRFERIVLATGNETRLYKSFAPDARAVTVPNGVDLDFFQPFDLPKAETPTLVFTGQMDYFANVDGVVHFARVILPRLRRRFPDLEFLIVGRAPAPAVRALGDLPGVMVTGAVGDVRPFLSRAWGFVAPLRIAQGVQNKVLEAMASALPVVCTDRVLAGLTDGDFQHGRDLLAAAGDEAMEQCLVQLLEDAGLRERLAECARQRLLASYRWQTNMDRFEETLAGVARRRSAAPGRAVPLARPMSPAALTEAGKVRSA